jgi:hypothetical protein
MSLPPAVAELCLVRPMNINDYIAHHRQLRELRSAVSVEQGEK